MLKQRVITALVLMAILLPALWADALWPFAVLSLVFVAAGGWEWARLNDAPGWRAYALGSGVVGACLWVAQDLSLPVWDASVTALPGGASSVAEVVPHVHRMGEQLAGFIVPSLWWWLAASVWVLGGAWALKFGPSHWRSLGMGPRGVLGLGLLVTAWLALTEAKLQGLNFLLSILCLVWAADIGAYFGGRRFGRRKLAPSISPGKSWEGVVAGLIATLLLAVVWVAIDRHLGVDSPSLYSRLLMGLGPAGLAAAVALLTAVSVMGDLFESMIKRQAGEKDSSQLLPGHGGVLDRIDAVLPVLPVALALLTLCHA